MPSHESIPAWELTWRLLAEHASPFWALVLTPPGVKRGTLSCELALIMANDRHGIYASGGTGTRTAGADPALLRGDDDEEDDEEDEDEYNLYPHFPD